MKRLLYDYDLESHAWAVYTSEASGSMRLDHMYSQVPTVMHLVRIRQSRQAASLCIPSATLMHWLIVSFYVMV